MADPENVARGILEKLQNAFVSKDRVQVADLLDDQLVLFGTAAQNLDRKQSRDYVELVLSQDGAVRWNWDEVVPLLYQPDVVVVFAVVGTVGFEDAHGQPDGEREAFRLTCLAVARDGDWRLRHFHGSIPHTA